MAATDSADDFTFWFQRLRDGKLIDFLRHGQFPAWTELASRELIARELASRSADLAVAQVLHRSQIEALARRLILSRDADLLDRLRPLWRAFGTNDKHCDDTLQAVNRARSDWRGKVPVERGTNDIAFSAAHAEFLEAMIDIARGDGGVLGAAIRGSRIANEAIHIGFPVVVGSNVEPTIRSAIWVESTVDRRARGLKQPQAWRNILRAVANGGAIEECPALPRWFRAFRSFARKEGHPVEGIDSAGLSLAMQLLADQQRRPLPFGIGFTGCWDEDGRLRGVSDLGLKLEAAADAGVFLLFACNDPSESTPEPTKGVRLFLLEEKLSIDEVVRQVNRVCAESGLTEYRWRRESEKLKSTAYTSIGSRDLPDANNDDACPVGFVGRDDARKRLDEWRRDSRKAAGRRIHAVIGAGQTGKTTLLSKWASGLPFFPVWFSFRRRFEPRGKVEQMRQAIEAQIDARFAVIHLPDAHERGRVEDTFAATDAAVDIVVDGIDEAETAEEQERIPRGLQEIGGTGLLLIGSQHISALGTVDHVPFHLGGDVSAAERDALQFIDGWAKKFDAEKHRVVAANLRDDQWRHKLVKGSGGNLAVLDAVFKKARDGVWPSTPGELILAKEFNEYGELLLDHIKSASDFKPAVEDFIAFRAFLDGRCWPVLDVLALMECERESATLREFSGSGPSALRQFIEITDGKCRFWNPNLHEFARQQMLVRRHRLI